jgi:hypothetical protein
LKLLYEFLDGIAIRNHPVSPSVKMSSEYLLCHHRVFNF